MKADILKIAGVKNEKEFYKLFPTEEAFMTKHGAAFKKAMRGAKVKKAQGGLNVNPSLPGFPVIGEVPELPTFGNATRPVGFVGGKLPAFSESMSDYVASQGPATNYQDLWSATSKKGVDWGSMTGPAINVAEGIVKGFQQLKDEKRKLQEATQWKKVSDVTLQASQLTPERIEREYVRPDDIINAGDEFFPVYGAGKGVLAKKGAKIPKAQFGDILQGIGSERLTNFATQLSGGESAGSTFGGVAGDIVSMIPGVGPIVGTLAKPVLSAVGNLIDTNPEKIKKQQDAFESNIGKMAMAKGAQNLFNMNNAHMANGGQVPSHNIDGLQVYEGSAEQVSPDFVKFNGPSHAEGGMNITYGNNPVEVEGGEYATETPNEELVILGDLKNPMTGRMFKRDAAILAKNTAKETKKLRTLVEKAGDMKVTRPIDKIAIDTVGLMADASRKKLREYDETKNSYIAMQEAMNKTADEMGLDAKSLSMGKVKRAKKGATISKAQAGNKYILDPSNEEAIPQSPDINAWANYLSSGLVPTIRKPVYRYEYGPESEGGPRTVLPEVEIFPNMIPEVEVRPKSKGTKAGSVASPSQESTSKAPVAGGILPTFLYGPSFVAPKFGEATAPTGFVNGKLPTYDEWLPQYMSSQGPASSYQDLWSATSEGLPAVAGGRDESSKSDKWKEYVDYGMEALDSILPYFRPSDVERLDPRQIMGEMMALTDKEEPVQAQKYHPELSTPYSVSLQDQKNEVIAQARAAQRMAGNNPAAQAMIASQASQALNKIQAEEFRLNQAMRDKVYGENRAMLNDAQLKNLQILDQQYERQATAKSKTKALWREALMSISDKYMKNQLNNRTLAAYENLYNYRFDDRFRAQNWNAPYYAWDYSGIGFDEDEYSDRRDMVARYEVDPITGERRVVGWRKKTKEEKEKESKGITARNGAIIKAMRNL